MDHAAAPVPVGGLLRVLGHEVRVDVRPGADPALTPLLLLTGLGGNVEMWEPFRSDLAARTGVATIAYDVPGTGESPPSARPLPLWAHGAIAVGVLDAVGVGRADVLGLSWGGLLAQQVAAADAFSAATFAEPRRVRRLVLANTNYGFGSVPGVLEAWGELATPRRYSSTSALASASDVLGGSGRPAPEHAAARVGRPPSPVGYLYQLLALAGWTSLPVLPVLGQRALVLNGDDDRAVPLANSLVMSRLLPAGELAVVPGGGHLMLFERTAEVVEVVAEFLTRR